MSGISIIKRAIELDSSKRYTECLICYQEGMQILLQVLKDPGKSEEFKSALKSRLAKYMDRAEQIKSLIQSQKTTGRYHEQITIRENTTGYSYHSVMYRFLQEKCDNVQIDDPYIRSHHQILNFLRFCELLVNSQCGVKVIKLKTGSDTHEPHNQRDKVQQISQSLNGYGVRLEVQYSDSLHDREIRLSSGWVIKIGRGLDYFKPPQGKLTLGTFNFDLRQCHETTIDIFYKLS